MPVLLVVLSAHLFLVHARVYTCITECYEQQHADFIIEAVKDTHPYHSRLQSGGMLKFHNGLLYLSKFPIKKETLIAFKKVSTLEKYLASKSMLVIEVDIPKYGECVLLNMHTTAGGTTDPEHPDVDTDREDELRQALDHCKQVESLGKIGIILGDLNCGPEASPSNYEYCLDAGFRDTYIEAVNSGRLEKGPTFTWDPENYLNKIGPHSNSPGQRCDHLLLPVTSCDHISVDNVKVVFEELVAPYNGKNSEELSTLSDHYGLVIGLSSSK